MMKLLLDSRQIFKDIGVIKLEIIYHQSVAVVVNKLGALIKKGAVVLIRLNHKNLLPALSFELFSDSFLTTQARRQPKVTGTPPIKNPGFNPARNREFLASILLVVVLPWVPDTDRTC